MSGAVIIVQARMTSTRLPGKVTMRLGDATVLGHVLERCSESRLASRVVVAAPDDPRSEAIAAIADSYRVPVVLGPEHDVLRRYRMAADAVGAETVVRVTADCPLVDPLVIDQCISSLDLRGALGYGCDLVTNVLNRTFPKGMDVEVLPRGTLQWLDDRVNCPRQREHVTLHIYENPGAFRILSVESPVDLSAYRLTLDTVEDYERLAGLFRELALRAPARKARLKDVVRALERREA